MSKWLENIYVFINRDVTHENETKRYAVVLRVLSLLMFSCSLIHIIIFIVYKSLLYVTISSICLAFYTAVLYFTYKGKTVLSMWIMNAILITRTVVSVLFMGWDAGMQQFLLVPLVLYMFSSVEKKRSKFIFATFLVCVRMVLFYSSLNTDIVNSTFNEINFRVLQVINTIYIYLSLSMITYNFSISSRESEEKLITYNKKLERLAVTDGLTGLMNRRSMLDYLKKMESEEKRYYALSSIAIGDIDHFKKVNDTYGHECGDVFLVQLSGLMRDFMEGKGLIARWGGEEFLLFFEGYNGDEAQIKLFDLQNQIREMEIIYEDQVLKATMTFGLEEYIYTDHLETIKRADAKLYMGKNSGRDRIVY